MSRVANLNAIRCGKEGFKADIYSNGFASFGQRFGWNIIAGNSHKPFTSRCPANSYGLNIPFYRTRQSELESANIGNGEILAFKPPAGLFKGKGVISVFAFNLVAEKSPCESWGMKGDDT